MTDNRTRSSRPRSNKSSGSLTNQAVFIHAVETIESLVVAFILAFILRAFVVEAFQIPTGSMAPTLYGAHRTWICSNCGHQFAFEIEEARDRHGRLVRLAPEKVICPNCRYNEDYPAGPGGQARSPVEGGDRILAIKLQYDLARWFPALGPDRWDVVLFKNPSDMGQNFIKRLIGLPGEKLEIIDGDIFINDQVVSKPDHVQEQLWFTVYNNDYAPRNEQARVFLGKGYTRTPRWVAVDDNSPWQSGSPQLHCDAIDRSIPSAIVFDGSLDDFYGYDAIREDYARFQVGDLRIRFMLSHEAGDGSVYVRLGRHHTLFTVEINPSAGTARLYRADSSDGTLSLTSPIAEGSIEARPGEAMQVAFSNVDYTVRLDVNGKTVLYLDQSQYYGPQQDRITASFVKSTLAAGRQPYPTAQIAAAGVRILLSHLILERDVYYRYTRMPPDGHELGIGVQDNPIYLDEDAYYVLGDNSPRSKDSRLWDEVDPLLRELKGDDYQQGTVPRDQMIGQGFFVYWPAAYRPFGKLLPLIPNVGDMRFIR